MKEDIIFNEIAKDVPQERLESCGTEIYAALMEKGKFDEATSVSGLELTLKNGQRVNLTVNPESKGVHLLIGSDQIGTLNIFPGVSHQLVPATGKEAAIDLISAGWGHGVGAMQINYRYGKYLSGPYWGWENQPFWRKHTQDSPEIRADLYAVGQHVLGAIRNKKSVTNNDKTEKS